MHEKNGGDGPIQARARLAPVVAQPTDWRACCLYWPSSSWICYSGQNRQGTLEQEEKVTRYTASVAWKRKMGDGDDSRVQRPARADHLPFIPCELMPNLHYPPTAAPPAMPRHKYSAGNPFTRSYTTSQLVRPSSLLSPRACRLRPSAVTSGSSQCFRRQLSRCTS